MSEIRFYNTKTRKKEAFQPIDPKDVRMYVCGPTVYDRAHIGNARPVIVFDMLYRLLRHVYGTDHVTYARNFTDVDDKIIKRAADSGRKIEEITSETITWYHEDMEALGTLRPNVEPRATDHIGDMIAMIADLIASNHAYVAEGHVLFSVESYARYGQLSGRSVKDMIAGARVEIAPYKRDPMDFVLWKPSDAGQPGWNSPWGRGRPGWHIECSAMSYDLFGASFDIHGGGNDLMFPHHENELAQSCCAHPKGDFARFWLHNEMLKVEGRKMSKSLGNFFTVRDLLDRGVPGAVIRFVLLSTHYRKPMDWTELKVLQCQGELHKWSYSLAGTTSSESVSAELIEALADDLNTPKAITHLRALYSNAQFHQLAADASFLGLWTGQNPDEISRLHVTDSDTDRHASRVVTALLSRLDTARSEKNYALADSIRDRLSTAGVIVKTSKLGTSFELGPNFDPAKLESLT